MVTFDKTDVCLLIVIVASISYLYVEDEIRYVRPDANTSDVPEDFDAEKTTEDLLAVSARDCRRGASATSRLIVDFSDSKVDSRSTAEDILDAFFTVRRLTHCKESVVF